MAVCEETVKEVVKDMRGCEETVKDQAGARQDVRLIEDLRVEVTAALQTESDAISRLDKRLWLLDQRLERRINGAALQRTNVVMALGDDRSPSPRYRASSPGWNIIGGRLI